MPSYPNPVLPAWASRENPPEWLGRSGYDRVIAADKELEALGYGALVEGIDITPEEHDQIIDYYKGKTPVPASALPRLKLLSLFANAERTYIPVRGSYFVADRAAYREEFRRSGYTQLWIEGNENRDALDSVRVMLTRILANWR